MSFVEETMARYRDVVVNNSSRTVLELSLALQKRPEAEQRAALGGTFKTGFAYLYRNETLHPDKVMESVVSPDGDAITSLYQNHGIFTNHGTLMNARGSLIAAISEKIGLSPEAIGVEDPARGRTLFLRELGTGQLIDILAERLGTTIVTSGSHGGDVDIARAVMPS